MLGCCKGCIALQRMGETNQLHLKIIKFGVREKNLKMLNCACTTRIKHMSSVLQPIRLYSKIRYQKISAYGQPMVKSNLLMASVCVAYFYHNEAHMPRHPIPHAMFP